MAVGPGYLGLGAYKDYRNEDKIAIPHIDLKGIGILFVNSKFVLGYSKLSILYSSEKLKDSRIKLSQAEIAFGKEAEKMAFEIQKRSKEGEKR